MGAGTVTGTRVDRGDAIAVMTRLPQAGRVKTRLQTELSGREAADLHAALAADLVAELDADSRWHLSVFLTPSDRMTEARAWLGDDVDLRPQTGDDLGARMHHAIEELLAAGHRRVVVVGTDAPGLDPERVANSLSALDDADLVLGPCLDGGYYLIGMKRPTAPLFDGVPWGSDRVLGETVRRAEALDLDTVRLMPLSDIDTWSDLMDFRVDQLHDVPAGRLSRTRPVIARIFAERSATKEVSHG